MKPTAILSLFVGIIFLTLGAFFYLNSPPRQMKDEVIWVKSGNSVRGVAFLLEERRLIKNKKLFISLAIFKKSKILAGKYKISKGMTASAILAKLSKGEVIKRKVTIPEGYNLYDIADLLEANKIVTANDFLHHAFDARFLKSLGIPSHTLEGYIYPETYFFEEGKGAKATIEVMHTQLNKVLDSIDFSILTKLKLSKYQLLTLASIIEKEAKVANERKRISSVFHNRLNRGMRLDSDPTVRYAVKKFKGRIRYKDLSFDSPYNTRRYKGLTPTPICSPGRESIVAALNPENSDYLYFVARNDGSHYFSKTLREHNRAVNYYQRGIDNGFIDN